MTGTTAIVKRKNGRPALYDVFLAAEVLMRLARAESLTRICTDSHMPSMTTVMEWVIDDTQGFAGRYARARMIGAELIFEECLVIADTTEGDWEIVTDQEGNQSVRANHYHIHRARLMVDARKFFLAKMYPKKFGEQAEKLAAEEERAAEAAARGASDDVAPIIRPQISRDEWLRIHGIGMTATGSPAAESTTKERGE